MYAGGDGPRTCGAGHLMTRVTRGSGVRDVCAVCVAGALAGAAARAARVTVNDYLLGLDEAADAHPRLARADADAAAAVRQAAAEVYGGGGAVDCRKLVRVVAKADRVTAAEVMGWELPKFARRVAAVLEPAGA